MRMPIRSWKNTLSKLGLKLVEKKPTRTKRKPRHHQIESLEAKQLLVADLFESEDNDTISTADIASPTAGTEYLIEGYLGDGSYSNDVDLYQFTLAAGQSINADLDGYHLDDGSYPSSAPYTYLRLFDSGGTEVDTSYMWTDTDPDSGYTDDPVLDYTSVLGGTYYLGVSDEYDDSYDPTTADSGYGGSYPGDYELQVNLTSVTPLPEITVEDANDVVLVDGTSTIDFSSTTTGTSVSHTFEVRNDGTADLTLGTPTVPTGFTLTSGPGLTTLTSGSSTTFTVQLDAATAGSYSGNVSFTNNDADENPFDFTVSGTVTAPVDLNESEDNDTISTADVASPTAGTEYLIEGYLGDGSYSNDVDLYQFTLVAGQSIEADLDGYHLDDGSYPSSAPYTYLRLFDSGGTEVDTSYMWTDTDPDSSYTDDPVLDYTSILGGTYYLGVSDEYDDSYDPTTADSGYGGSYPGDYELQVNLTSVTPLPEITVEDANDTVLVDGTSTFNFSSTTTGTSVSHTFEIRNDGTADLTLGTPTVPTGFTLSSGPSLSTLISGASTTFTVQLDATAAGSYSGTVSFTNNDSDENPFDFDVSGTVTEPALSINDISVDETAGTATFTVTLSPTSANTVTVDYTTADDSANASSDYTLTSGTLTFLTGESSKTITVPILDDSLVEADESFTVTLTNAVNASLADDQGIGTIDSEDLPPADVPGDDLAGAQVVTLVDSVVTELSANIGDGSYTGADVDLFQVSLTAGQTLTIDVDAYYDDNGVNLSYLDSFLRVFDSSGTELTTNDDAQSANDFANLYDSYLSFVAPSTGTFYIGVSAFGNSAYDPTTAGTGNATTTGNYKLQLLVDVPPGPALSLSDTSVDEDAGTASFTVTLDPVSANTVTVDYTTADTTAIAGSDYTLTSGTLTFLAGESSKTITVPILDDSTNESDETFTVTLSNVSNATLADDQGTGTIVNEDLPPADVPGDDLTGAQQVSLTVGVQTEIDATIGDGSYVNADVDLYEVTLTAGQTITVDIDAYTDDSGTNVSSLNSYLRLFDSSGSIKASNSNATSSNDYASNSLDSYLSFVVPTTGAYYLGVSADSYNISYDPNTSGTGSTGGTTGSYKLQLLLSDPPGPTISISDAAAAEDVGTATFTVTLDAASASTVTVDYTTVDGTATAGTDYTLTSGTLTFLAGETSKTISVPVTDDGVTESQEAFTVSLSNPSGGNIADATGDGTIVDAVPANVAPTVSAAIADTTVTEDSATYTLNLATVFADANIAYGDTLTYSITANSDTTIAAVSVSGDALIVTPTENQNGSSTITIRATDSASLYVEDTFLLTVSAENDTPTLENYFIDHFIEMDNSDIVIDLATYFDDVDLLLEGDSLTYSVTNDNGTLVTATELNGELTLAFTAATYGDAGLVVRATDTSGAFVEDTFHTYVSRSNATPTVAAPVGTLNSTEGDPLTILDLSTIFADTDIATFAGDESLRFHLLENSNDLVATDLSVISAFTMGEDLYLVASENSHGQSTIKVRAVDQFGEFVEETFTVVISAVNDTPTIVETPADVSVEMNSADTVLDLSTMFDDVDIVTDADVVTISVESVSDPTLLTASITGTDLTLDYLTDQYGSSTVTIRATDIAGAYVEHFLNVAVAYSISAPTVTSAIADITVSEDGTLTAIDLSTVFDDADILANSDALSYSFAVDLPGLLTGDVTGDQLQLTLVPDAFGVATVTVTATDLAGLRVTDVFTVTISSVNDAPTVAIGLGSLSYTEGVKQTVINLAELFADKDLAGGVDTLTYSVVSNSNSTLSTASISGSELLIDYTATETGSVDIVVKAEDSTTASVQTTVTITIADTATDYVGKIDDFGLVNDTDTDGDKITYNAGVTAQVHAPIIDGSISIEFDHDGDGVAEGFDTILPPDALDYDHLFYDPRFVDDTLNGFVGTMNLNYRSGEVDITGIVTTYRDWSLFSYTLVAPPVSSVTATVSLKEDSGENNSDGITSNPDLTGTTPDGFSKIEIDTDGDQVVDGTVYSDLDGNFDFSPLLTTYGSITIDHRTTAWDEGAAMLLTGPWTSMTFTLEEESAPDISTLTLASEFTLDDPELDENGDPIVVDPVTTSLPWIVGTIENTDAADLSYTKVEFDLNNDGTADDSANSDVDGLFSYLPIGLTAGSNTVQARVVKLDFRTDGEVLGDWFSYTFNYEANPVPEVEQLKLLNDTGDDATDSITEDATVTGRLSFTSGIDLNTVFLEFDHNADDVSDGITVPYSDGTFDYRPTGLAVGTHTIRARATIWDDNLQDFAEGVWTSITFTTEQPTNVAATLGTYELDNDNGTDDADGKTSDPTLTGTIANDGPVGYWTIEFDHDGDGLVDGTTNADGEGTFKYVPVGVTSGAYTVSARVREWDYTTGDIITGAWQDFTFTVEDPVNNAATVDTLVLVADTGSSSTDNITANLLLAGTVTNVEGQDNLLVQLDYDNDGTVDGNSFTDSDGNFTHEPIALAYATHTIRARAKEWDQRVGVYIIGAWTSITVTYEAQTNVAADITSFALVEDTGTSDADSITSNATVQGTIINAEFLSGVTIDIDTDSDGSADAYTTTDNMGQFSYSPVDPSVGSITLKVRTREFNHSDGSELTGSWQTLTFTYEEATFTAASIDSIALVNDTGDDDTDKITTDATLEGQISSDREVSGLQIQIDSNNDGVFDLLTATDETGHFEYKVYGLVDGDHTVALRVKEYDQDQVAVYSSWSTFDFTLEPLVSASLPDISEFGLLNDTGLNTSDSSSTDGTLTGTLSSNLGSGNITVEFDHNSDGIVDGTTTTIAGETFSYLPEGLEDGYHSINAKVAGTSDWSSTDFITSANPDAQDAQDLLATKAQYEQNLQDLEYAFTLNSDSTKFDYDSAIAAAITTYDTAKANSQSTYSSTVDTAQQTFQTILDSAIATEQAARTAANAQFAIDLAAFAAGGGDTSSFQFNGFKLPDAPQTISYQAPNESDLPQAPTFQDASQSFQFKPTQDPTYQDVVETALQNHIQAMQGAMIVHNGAIQLALSNSKSERGAIKETLQKDINAAKRQHAVDVSQEPLKAGDPDPNNPGAFLKETDEDVVPDLDKEITKAKQKIAKAKAKYEKSVVYKEGLGRDDIITLETLINYDFENSENSDLLKAFSTAQIAASTWVVPNTNYEGNNNSSYDATYATERAILQTVIDQIDYDLANWTPDPDDDIYEQAAAQELEEEGAEADKKAAYKDMWKALSTKENAIDTAAWTTLEKLKDQLAKVEYKFQTATIKATYDLNVAQIKKAGGHQTIKNTADSEQAKKVSEAHEKADIDTAGTEHTEVTARNTADATQTSSQQAANAARVSSTNTGRNASVDNFDTNDGSDNSSYQGTQDGHRDVLEAAIETSITTAQDTIDASRDAALSSIADTNKQLSEDIAALARKQRDDAADVLLTALKAERSANTTFMLDEAASYKKEQLAFAKHNYDELLGLIDNYQAYETSVDNGYHTAAQDSEASPPEIDERSFHRAHYATGATSGPDHEDMLNQAQYVLLVANLTTYKTYDLNRLTSIKVYKTEYQAELNTQFSSVTDGWAEYQRQMVSIGVSAAKNAIDKQIATASTNEDTADGHNVTSHDAGKLQNNTVRDAGANYVEQYATTRNNRDQQIGAEYVNNVLNWDGTINTAWSAMNLLNATSFNNNSVVKKGDAGQAYATSQASIQAELAKKGTGASIDESKKDNTAASGATKTANSDGAEYAKTDLTNQQTYALAMITAYAEYDKAKFAADTTFNTTEAYQDHLLQTAYRTNHFTFDKVELAWSYYVPNSGASPPSTSLEQAVYNQLESNLTAQVVYATNLATAEYDRVEDQQGAETGFAGGYFDAFSLLASATKTNDDGLADKDKTNADGLNDKLNTHGETRAETQAGAGKTAATESTAAGNTHTSSSTDADLDEQDDNVINKNTYDQAGQDDFAADQLADAGDSDQANHQSDVAAFSATLLGGITSAIDTLRGTVQGAVSTLVGGINGAIASAVSIAASAGSKASIESAKASGTEARASGTATTKALVAATKAETAYATTTGIAAAQHYKSNVAANAAAAIAIAAADEAWVHTMAPAKKTYELGMAALDATIIAAGYTVDDAQGNPILDSNGNSSADHVAWEAKVKADYEEALNEPDDPEIEFEEGVTGSADDPMGANIRRNKDIAAAQTAQLQALGAAVVVHATTLGSAIVTRASGLGGAVTGLASDWATATSTFVQTIGGVISTLSSGLNSAESTSHSQIVSATEGFSGTVDPATSQNLTDTNTAILGYVTSTNASQYDYWEDQSSTQSTDLATRSTNNSSITEFQDAADKSSGSDSFLVNYRPDYLANGDTQITDLLSYGTSMFDVNSQLGSSAASGLNSYGTTALGKGHAWQSSAVGSGNEYGQKLSDAAGDYDTGSTGVSTTLGNTLAGNYAAYLTNVVQTEVDFALGDKTEAERDTELLAADNQQIADTADADLEYAEGIATEIKTNNVSNFQADAGYTKTMAGHDKTYANGVAEAGASLGTGMAIAITAGWTAETNAVNAANLAAAANTGERAKDWSGSQLVGVTTMDTNIGTPFSGYLKDKSTATSNAAVTQKTLAITKVLDENDARTLYNNMAVMQYLVMSASTGGAEAGLTTTAASSAAAASDAIAGSWESNGTDLAGAVDAYQKAEAALQRDHRVAVELANRSGGDASAVAALIAAADLALNDALPGLAATYFTAEIAADYGFQITEATEQRGHANNVGAAVVGATAAIGAARTGYAQAEADGNSAQQTSLANIDAAFKEDFQDASYDEAVLALTGSDPWTTKLLAEELAKQTLVSTVAPARATGLIALAAAQTTKEKADATSAETKANEQAVAAHDDMVNQWDAIVDDLTGKQEAEDGANDLFVAMSEGKENDNPATDVNEPGAIHNAYGDVESSSTTRSETKTPNIDDLASEGLKFRSPPQVGTTSRVDLLNLQHIGQSLQATSLSDIDLTSINDIFSKTKNNPTLQREVYIKLFADAYYNGDIDKATLDINKYVKALAYINTNPTLSNNAHLSFGSAASTNLIITQAAIDQAWEETFSIELTRAYYTLHPLDPAPLTSNGSVGPVINGSTLLESKLEKLLSRLNEIYEDRAKAVRPTDWLISGTAWYTVSLEEEQARLESSLKMWHRGYMGLVMGKTVWEEIKSTLMDVELQTAFIQLMGARVPVNQVSGKRITAPRRKDTGNTTAVKPINLSRAKIQSNEAGKKLVSNAVKGKWNEVARRSGDPLDVQSAYSGKPIKYRNGKAYIEEYKLDGVNFDRFKDGVLGDVKADYGFAARVGKYNPKLNAIQDLLNEAGRQIPVARKHGLPLEWHVRKQDFNFFKNVLNQRGYLDHITLVTY